VGPIVVVVVPPDVQGVLGVGETQGRPGPCHHRPPPPPASEPFPQRLPEQVLIQGQVGHELLELVVFPAELPELPPLGDAEAAEALLPPVTWARSRRASGRSPRPGSRPPLGEGPSRSAPGCTDWSSSATPPRVWTGFYKPRVGVAQELGSRAGLSALPPVIFQLWHNIIYAARGSASSASGGRVMTASARGNPARLTHRGSSCPRTRQYSVAIARAGSDHAAKGPDCLGLVE
jgi:hypothetical protein